MNGNTLNGTEVSRNDGTNEITLSVIGFNGEQLYTVKDYQLIPDDPVPRGEPAGADEPAAAVPLKPVQKNSILFAVGLILFIFLVNN